MVAAGVVLSTLHIAFSMPDNTKSTLDINVQNNINSNVQRNIIMAHNIIPQAV